MSFEGDFDQLWELVVEQFHGGPYSIHGPQHWQRVMENGLLIAPHSGANEWVVRLFALFHDSRRLSDGNDFGHGLRGAEYALKLRGEHFQLSDHDFELLYYACEWHTDQKHHEDPTIRTCWDADRLDLGRVATLPDPEYMSTEAGKKAAEEGTASLLQ